MTRVEAVLLLGEIVNGLPPGTLAERVGKAAERLAAHPEADALRGLLVELGLEKLVVEMGR